MRSLFDVNFVIALLDPDHVFHERSHSWWADNSKLGWASCPLSENGVVRIMSNPNYSTKIRFSPSQLIDRLQKFTAQTDHEFWPDSFSLLNGEIFDRERIHGSRQQTDIYLLALAVKHFGRLVTFDQSISVTAVFGAGPDHLCVS